MAEHVVGAGMAREYVWLGDTPQAVVDAAAGASGLYYVHVNHLDRPALMTDASKTVVWRASYEPFGAVRLITGPASLDLRFPGQWFQLEAGLAYNWNRHYDPTLGRYTQPDPLGFVDGPNVYGYVGQRPMTSGDPTGLYELHRQGSISMHSYPGPQAGGNEHARQGPGGDYHVHLRDRAGGPDARISTGTWKPLTPDDEAILNKNRNMRKFCDNLSDADKRLFDKINRQIFHRGSPSVNQLLRLGGGRGGVRQPLDYLCEPNFSNRHAQCIEQEKSKMRMPLW
ncbi:hypothetical protein GCM10008171_17190 [Methylopila jiangsuensis]|uniref:Teneurin-like YD-shell domain-containing protein n=1 Tax=Methylopila jiangsuensis TaxID=586230 RepID=A0A9W6N3L7_9HYPH|nr:RHS repeat-associated core domain-containing protein [Methylopila jiangsuensis]MDR6284022.1 RHS repeat-associated protein [Methylopila jiangsuensis]GLK76465.1 hypothetical protein GCM10008171_17190 [Methylopila jiangsuensis]